MFFPHLGTNRKGILNAIANEAIPLRVTVPAKIELPKLRPIIICKRRMRRNTPQSFLDTDPTRLTANGCSLACVGRRHTYNFTCRNRRAFEMTDTELSVIAALAIMGLKSIPRTG